MKIVEEQNHDNSNNKRTILGIILILVGIVWIARKMDLIPYEVSHIIISWQMLLIGIGLLNIFTKENYRTGLILITIGSFFILPKFIDIPYDMRNMFWPAILVVVGVLMMTVKNRHGKITRRKGASENYIDLLNVMSGGKRNVTSDNFLGGRVTSVFGGSELDLTSAKIKDGKPVIDVFTIFGGCEIYVPRDWDVQVEVTAIFGGFDDKRRPVEASNTEDKKVVFIKGLTLFGGGEVKS